MSVNCLQAHVGLLELSLDLVIKAIDVITR